MEFDIPIIYPCLTPIRQHEPVLVHVRVLSQHEPVRVHVGGYFSLYGAHNSNDGATKILTNIFRTAMKFCV